MKRRCQAVIAVAFAILPNSTLAQDLAPMRFENATAGIALTRPAGWVTASLQTVQENRERLQLSDQDFQAAMQKAATAPLFVFMKHPEPHPSLNPSIQVTLRPLGQLAGLPPTELMRMVTGPMKTAFADFVIVTGISDAQVSGLAGAHMRAKYTLKNQDGAEFQVLARMWLVPRGSFLFIIGMSGPQEGPDVSESEFGETLASISMQK